MYKIPSAIVAFSELDTKPLTQVADPITVLGLYSPLVDKATNLWCQHHSYHHDQMGCDKRDQAVKFLGLWNPLFLISSYALNQNNVMKCYVIDHQHSWDHDCDTVLQLSSLAKRKGSPISFNIVQCRARAIRKHNNLLSWRQAYSPRKETGQRPRNRLHSTYQVILIRCYCFNQHWALVCRTHVSFVWIICWSFKCRRDQLALVQGERAES